MAIDVKDLEQFVKDKLENVRYIEVFTIDDKKYNFFFTINNEEEQKFVAFDYADGKKVRKRYSDDKRIDDLAKSLVNEKGIENFHIQAVFDH